MRRGPKRQGKICIDDIIDESMLKDPKDCHRLPFLEDWLGKRAIIQTSKGTIKGRLCYASGWYYSQAPFRKDGDEWVKSPYRFLFRKGQFKSIELSNLENSRGE